MHPKGASRLTVQRAMVWVPSNSSGSETSSIKHLWAVAEVIDPDGHVVDSEHLAALCDRFGVVELAVFGSVARGSASPDSDIDLLYELAPGARLGFDLFYFEDGLTELFGRTVDLVSKRAVRQLMRESVLADAVVVYAA